MRWKELIEFLLEYPYSLDDDVTIYDPILDEYYPVTDVRVNPTDDVLSKGEVYLVLPR